VARVENINRLSALASACAPATSWLATVAQARTNVLGLSAVEIQATTAPVFGLRAVDGAPVKINNYMGYTSAMGEGMAATTSGSVAVLVQQDHPVLVVKATSGNARGIPPRGRPV
jgi:hypothetical protein